MPLSLETLRERVLPAGVLAVGTDAGTVATVRTFVDSDDNGTYETLAGEFQPFGGFTGGVRVAMGDFDGDGNEELVTGMGGGQGVVKIWSVNTDGTVGGLIDSIRPFNVFAQGVFVAAGDADGDGRDELAVCRNTNGARVHVYSDTNGDGRLSDNLVDTFAPFGPSFRGGTRIAFGDTNAAGGEELIVARGPGASAVVKVYSDADADGHVSDDPLVESFLAFGSSYTGGAFVASGSVAGAGGAGAEIIVGRETGAGRVRIFTDANADGMVGNEAVFDEFVASGPSATGGVRVAAGDTDDSGADAVITGSGPGGNQVTIRKDSAVVDSFQAFAAGYSGGLFVAFGEVSSFDVVFPGLPIDIIGNTTITTTITIAPGAGTIADLDVSLSLAHILLANLNITLTHVSSGTTVTLISGLSILGSSLLVRLDDGAGTDILDAVPNAVGGAVCGVFNLAGSALLSVFEGLDASGDWVLSIADTGLGLGGTLLGWALHGEC